MASFLVLLDDSAVALALSTLGQDLGLGLAGLEWVVNLYTLTLAVFTLWGGMLADRLGPRRVLCGGLVAFSVISFAVGLSADGAALLVLRGAQGAGAAFIGPAALAVVTTSVPAARRGLAVGVWAGVSASALAGGPMIGALLTQTLGWRSIFLVNLPLGGLLLLAVLLALPPSPRRPGGGRLDVAGLLASGTALSALVLGLTQANSYGWTSVRLWAVMAVTVGAFAAFIGIERRAPAPLIDLSLFRLPNFLAGNLIGLLNLAIMCSLFFFLALYLQRGLLLSPVSAGAALLPFTALIAVVAPLAGRLTDRTGARAPIAAGMGLVAVGLFLLSRIGAGSGVSDIVPGLVITGLGLGLASTPITTAALASVPRRSAGIAAAAVSVSRLVGLALGVAAMGAIVSVGWPGGVVRTAADRAAFSDALGTGFAVNAVLALLAAAAALVAIRPSQPRLRTGTRPTG
jgi:EmrB/QacA subfamily drug resistance transporter